MRFISFLFVLIAVINLFAVDKQSFFYINSSKLKKIIRGFETDSERVTAFEYDQNERLIKVSLPNKVSIVYEYDLEGRLTSLKSSDATVNYTMVYSEDGSLVKCIDQITGHFIKRELTPASLLAKEIFPTGHTFTYSYNDDDHLTQISLADFGAVEYKYEGAKLVSVHRMSPEGILAYTHEYKWDKDWKSLVGEKMIAALGEVSYQIYPYDKILIQKNPYSTYEVRLDPNGIISFIKHGDKEISIKEDRFGYLILDDEYDCLGNPINAVVNSLSELTSYRDIACTYDLNGNMIVKKTPEKTYFFKYDALGRLTSAKTDNFEAKYTYDIFNRRLFKTLIFKDKTKTYTYLYQDNTEVAVLDSQGQLMALRILGACPFKGLYKSISIEKPNATYAPIYDYAYNIHKLVNIDTEEVIDYSSLDCYAQNIGTLCPIIPWIYSTQHYDIETQLIYYGDRYYDPSIRRWITPDPLGPIDSPNLYLFARNNPLKYIDIYGDFAVAVPILIWGARVASLAVPAVAPIVWGATAGIAAYQTGKHIKNHMEKKKEGKQHDGPPADNKRQNNQFRDACKDIEKKLGRKLTPKETDSLHRDVSKQGYGYHQILEEGYHKFDKK